MMQARIADPVQAMRVQIAIRWGCRPSKVAIARARAAIEKELAARPGGGETTVLWIGGARTW